ncbi:MAG: hypothetical protein MI919_42860 [Holophagales bacterium]|nr:hypothetical protein [Holophagales bacterium]
MSGTEHLRERTAQALRRLPASVARRPARLGDLLVAEHAEQRPDFWLLAEQRDTGWRLVPVDIDPICGRFDVALGGQNAFGALTARCALGLWIEASGIESLSVAGPVGEGELARIRSCLASVDRGLERGTELERETEQELEYLDLVAEIDRARVRLGGHATQPLHPAERNLTLPWRRRSSPAGRPHLRPWMLLAASWLFGLGLGLVLGGSWPGSSGLGSSGLGSSGLGSSSPGSTSPEESVNEKPPRSEPVAGLPFEWLAPHERLRGGPPPALRLEPDMPYLALFLEVGMLAERPLYRLELRRRDGGRVLWSREAESSETGEILVLVPTADLRSLDYELLLFELGEEASPEPLRTYGFRLVEKGRAEPEG